MKEAVFQYKCRMCGAVFDDDERIAYEFAVEHLGAAALDEKTIPALNVRAMTRMTIHNCDGSDDPNDEEYRVGLADLIGYRIEG